MAIMYRNDETVIYSDISLDPQATETSRNLEAVMGSLVNLLTTLPGERLNRPTYGVDLEKLLFEPLSDLTALSIYTNIYKSLEAWEPRVSLNHQKSKVNALYDEGAYELDLYFTVAGYGVEFNLRRYYKYNNSKR